MPTAAGLVHAQAPWLEFHYCFIEKSSKCGLVGHPEIAPASLPLPTLTDSRRGILNLNMLSSVWSSPAHKAISYALSSSNIEAIAAPLELWLTPSSAISQCLSTTRQSSESRIEKNPNVLGIGFELSLEWCGLVIHTTHAARTTRSRFFFLGHLSHQCFCGEHESGDRFLPRAFHKWLPLLKRRRLFQACRPQGGVLTTIPFLPILI